MMHWQRCTARLVAARQALNRVKEIGMSYWLDCPHCLMIVDGHLCSITYPYQHNFACSSQFCPFPEIELDLLLGILEQL